MGPDMYTKAVLTVIAGCLLYICAGRPAVVAPASAQVPLPVSPVTAPRATEVVIIGWKMQANDRGVIEFGRGGLPVSTR